MTTPDKKATILLVDDETANLGPLFEALRKASYKVFITKTATDTLLQVNRIQPDLILLDIMLPDMDGFELCRQIKANKALNGTPIIFLSALNDTADKLKGLNLSAVDYITKPFDTDEVVARIDKHLTIRNLQRQLEEKNAQLTQEIAEHKQTETALKKLSRVVEQTDDLVMITNTRGIIEYVNPAFERLTAYTRSEALGQKSNLLNSGEHTPEFYQNLWQTILRGQIFRGRMTNRKRDGTLFYEDKTITPLTNAQGEITHFVSTGKDITELVQTETNLQKAKEAAEAANQAKSAFLSNMSHELRTPLNAILGFSELTVHYTDLPLAAQKNMQIIQSSGQHLLSLINDVLDMSKIDAGKITLIEKPLNLNRFLQELEAMFSQQAHLKGLEFFFTPTANLPDHIKTAPLRLRQILINLIGNAFKFTTAGSVSVWVADITAANQAEKRRLQFEVRDTGPGIAPEELALLFEPFAQTQSGLHIQQGTGLGLAISRKFARLMGGDIRVDSKVGYGSSFWLQIEATVINQSEDSTTDWQSKPKVIDLKPNQPQYRILIVDDTLNNRQLLQSLLQPLGFNVKTAENGAEAVDLWRQWQPHLIFMDIRMPIMNGYEAARIIKHQTNIPLIAISASVYEEKENRVKEAGFDGFLRKPFQGADALNLLNKHLGVAYIFSESSQNQPNLTSTSSLSSEALATLPEQWQAELKTALIHIDLPRIEAIVAQITGQNPSLGKALTEQVNKFSYQNILNLLAD